MEHPQSGEARLNVLQAFETLPDPRTRECPHRLDELLLVAVCAITSGADSWVTVAEWGCMKLDWLRRFLPFANAIASHDTFSRVFALLDARRFEACFVDWMQQLCPTLQGQLVTIDGKSVRGSRGGELGTALHLVSAWHSAAGLVLGQLRTADKSNAITAIPALLDALDVRGASVSIDAMGCQRAIAEQIIDRGARQLARAAGSRLRLGRGRLRRVRGPVDRLRTHGVELADLPPLSPGDGERLRALCRLPTGDLPAPYDGQAPAKLTYCYLCVYLNPVDITVPYWQARWLLGMDSPWCHTHGLRYERTTASAVRDYRNMRRLARIIDRRRAAKERAAKWRRWTLAAFLPR